MRGIFGAMFAVVAGRLAYLQACATGKLDTDARVERTAHITLPHRRGAIYDRDGNVLARSIDATTICAHPNQIVDVNGTANAMASVLGGEAESYAELLNLDTTFVYIAKRVDPEVAARLKDMELVGLEFVEDSKRVYPMGEIAGNVIGCVGDDGHGLTGLELQYDDVLSGVDGSLVEERARNGEPIVGGLSERVDPIDGENIVVSIDIDIQRVAQEQLTATIEQWNAKSGCVIVMQPETGEVFACCSTPYLNPSDFSQAEAAAFNLRCVSDSYEPGSTYKPLTASMAIDLGVATPDTTYYVPAKIQVGDDMVGDSDGRDYDTSMTLRNVLELSSNVGAVLCAESVGASQFAAYSDAYQIGSLTGIDYPGEAPGLVATLDEYTGAWAAMAFGQSLAVPPIQMARAIAALGNEGVLVSPHFLVSRGGEQVGYPVGERVVEASTAAQVAEMMCSVIENGYGSTGKVEGYLLSGKTGTSERADPEHGGYLEGQFTTSFIGFGPTSDPKVLTYVLTDYVPGALGSQVAGAPWAAIMKAALSKLQIPPSG